MSRLKPSSSRRLQTQRRKLFVLPIKVQAVLLLVFAVGLFVLFSHAG